VFAVGLKRKAESKTEKLRERRGPCKAKKRLPFPRTPKGPIDTPWSCDEVAVPPEGIATPMPPKNVHPTINPATTPANLKPEVVLKRMPETS